MDNGDISTDPSLREGASNEECCLGGTLCNPRKTAFKYVLLFFVCFLGFGSFYCYDTPAALQDQTIRDMKLTNLQFSNLYAWYSWPNAILCFFSGFLIDRVFGLRLGCIIFSIFTLAGQLLLALGAYVNTFWLMEFGRLIFGIGNEALEIAKSTYTANWFRGNDLNMLFGVKLSFNRLGSVITFIVTPNVYEGLNKYYSGYTLLGVTFFVLSIFCVSTVLASFVIGFMDWKAEKLLNKAAARTGTVVRMSDVKDFPASFWIITGICVTYYSAVFPFVRLGTIFFARKYDLDQQNANVVDSVVYLIPAIISPVLGLLVDKIGKNLMWVFAAVFSTLICHLSLGFTYLDPWIPMVVMGFMYSLLASVLWAMVALEVPEYQLGTAYGIMRCAVNFVLTVVAIAAGDIIDRKGYMFLEIFFIHLSILSVILTIVLYFINSSRDGPLNMSFAEREAREDILKRTQLDESKGLLTESFRSDVTPQNL